jgi:hypothetical protein
MKWLNLIPISIILLFSCASVDCKLEPYGNEQSKNRIIEGEVRKPLVTPDTRDTGYIHISFSYYLEQDSSFKDSINNFISRNTQLMTEFEGEDDITPLSYSYFSNQADSFVAIYDEEKGIDEYAQQWDLEFGFDIDDHFSSFVEVSMGGWSYTGGAHGNGFSTYHMFDKSDGRILGLKDFFSDINELNKIAEPHFRELNGLSENGSLGEGDFWFENDMFSVNNNFYFTDQHVIFFFNIYEIAPYAGGSTELEIPTKQIEHLFLRDI